jgi:glycosyltransferase involved in cell wall biosynthesis
VAYVTECYLQSKYPASTDAVTAAYSSVDLPADAFLARPRLPRTGRNHPILISVGSLEQLYKGIDTLIRAVGQLNSTGMPVRLLHIGAGRFRPYLERLTAELGLGQRVEFVGALPAGAEVRRILDTADLFVMPSRTEGLPKALIEAMAWGLPAVGTAVGGIPELLAPEDLVVPDDVGGLASAIRRFIADPNRLAEASARNLVRAASYSYEVLTARRGVFYGQVRDAVTQWQRRGAAVGRRSGSENRIHHDSAMWFPRIIGQPSLRAEGCEKDTDDLNAG